MRLFIAIDIPSDEEYLKDIQKKIQTKGLSLAKHPHMTLKFLGEVKDEKVSGINDSLQRIDFNSFELTLTKIGFFPSSSKPRVVFVGTKQSNELMELQKKITEALPAILDDHEFHPHFTIARVKPFADKSEIKENIKSIKTKPIIIKVNNFKLKRSVLESSGPVYTNMFVYPAKDL
ncbi:MAG: RNA 2',3'-cyclic phosphodiesterase [Nanoarchaeota archaeon]|nr:MAG: RNA 2',3'-cyclic phosphodiesterase [Nanoarchaeota archaeon]